MSDLNWYPLMSDMTSGEKHVLMRGLHALARVTTIRTGIPHSIVEYLDAKGCKVVQLKKLLV